MRLSKNGVATCVLATASLAFWLYWYHRSGQVPSLHYDLKTGHEWVPLGGKWTIADGEVSNNSLERGAKLLTGSEGWQNYVFMTDLKFTGTNADMGVVLRVNEAREGTDAYNGYYVGLRTLDGSLVAGRSNFGWREASPVHVPGGVQPNVWYRLRAVAYGCDIAASALNLSTGEMAWLAFRETGCVATGRVGLRSLNSGAVWRNISLAPARWEDYVALRQHAAFVEHPEVLPTAPWWTPWHASVLFGSILLIVLAGQLTYFRMQQWKAYTIMRERERLAHDIHDTMAQSFAGIGYQIQGIYHNVLRSRSVAQDEIAEQLNVAYQLVRRCHEEASRTIAMLGAPMSLTPEELLGSLRETASKIAGEQIKIITELQGSSARLNLRIADALFHIGREAISNAVSHSGLSELKIILNHGKTGTNFFVEDDGCGFDMASEKAGFGIQGMQKRARDIGASLQVVSVPGQGTKVQVLAGGPRQNFMKRTSARLKVNSSALGGRVFHRRAYSVLSSLRKAD